MVGWRDMSEFTGVDLEDSWVLGWRYDRTARRLTFDLEASRWPGHSAYDVPLPDEWTCYRPAVLAFENVASIAGLRDIAEARATVDPDGSRDYGNIDALRQEGELYRFSGEMGDVSVHAAYVRLVVSESRAPAG